jgi:Ni,Fe-hydrogenase I large subunit
MSKSYNDKTPADSRKANEKSPVPVQGLNPYIKFIDSLNSEKIQIEENLKQIEGHEIMHLEQSRMLCSIEHRLATLELLRFQWQKFADWQAQNPSKSLMTGFDFCADKIPIPEDPQSTSSFYTDD